MYRNMKIALALAAGTILSVAAYAAEKPVKTEAQVKAEKAAKAVKMRQGFMQMQSYFLGQLRGAAKAGKLDAESLANADRLIFLAGNVELMFVPGSSADEAGNTRAKSAIWTDSDEIAKLASRLQVRARGVKREVEGGDAAATAKALKQFGGACKACHTDYRANEYSPAK